MTVLFVLFLVYALPLLIWKPLPESLKEKTLDIPFGKRLYSVKGTLGMGFALILLFFLTSAGGWKESTPFMVALLGLSRGPAFLYYQLLTCNLVHANFIHLLGNLTVLGLLSAYERKKGTKRYLFVFAASGLFSALASFPFLPPGLVYLGASGGICGLAAAYYTDLEGLTFKEWLGASLAVLALVGFLSFAESWEAKDFHVDHLGHLFGAAGGFLVCRLFKEKPRTAWGGNPGNPTSGSRL